MLSLPRMCRYLALLFCVGLTGCALEKYSFQTFGNSNQPATAYASSPRSDELALIYADYVARLLEGRSTGARITREVSDSSLAVGGALLAATETLKISAETVAQMGVGIVIVKELQKIFNAGGRSEAFADAAYLIRQAQGEYRQFNPNPSSRYLTENGAILVSRVDAAVHAARKSLNGRLPALRDLQQATQPMTMTGATRRSSGMPQTMFNAAGEKSSPGGGQMTQEDVDAAVDARAKELKKRGPESGGQRPSQPVELSTFQAEVITLRGKLTEIKGGALEALWRKRYSKEFPGERAARDTIFNELTTFQDTNSQSDGMMSQAAVAMLKEWKSDIAAVSSPSSIPTSSPGSSPTPPSS